MLVTALTLVGYSVGISVISAAVKKSCNKKANENIAARIAALPEEHTEEEELAIVKNETLKSTAKFSLITAGVGVAGAIGATSIITNFDNPTISDNVVATLDPDDEPVSIETSEDGVTIATYEDGTTITTF